jgi:hypothetical protein
MLNKLCNFIENPQRHGTQRLHFASLVVLQSSSSTLYTGPTAQISTSTWSDSLNTRILYPVSIIQTFLPLLISESTSALVSSRTTLVVVTPSNVSSINTPHHAPESVTTAALTSYISTLRAELPSSLSLTHIRLGSILDTSDPTNRLQLALSRARYFRGSSPPSSSSSSPSRNAAAKCSLHGNSSNIRALNHSVFDAIEGRTSGTVFVGRGAYTYAMIGALAPSSFIGWMMGFGRNSHTWSSESKREDQEISSLWEKVGGYRLG